MREGDSLVGEGPGSSDMSKGGGQRSSERSSGVGIVQGRGESGQASRPHQSSCCSCGRVAEELCSRSWDGSVHGCGLAHWSVQRSGVAGGRGALGILPRGFGRKPLLLDLLAFPLVTPVLEPDLHLGLCELEKGSQLFPLVSRQVFLHCESSLQLIHLPMREQSPRSSLLSRSHDQ